MVFVVVSVIIILIVLIIRACANSTKVYACPNCGNIFTKRWYQLIFCSAFNNMTDELRLKCPSCKSINMCGETKR